MKVQFVYQYFSHVTTEAETKRKRSIFTNKAMEERKKMGP